MAGKTLRFFNLTGGLNTVQDLYTLNSSTNRTETPELYNVEYYKLGGLKSMEGNIQVGQTLPSKVTLGYEYIKADETIPIVTTRLNQVFRYDFKLYQWININAGLEQTFPERHSICSFGEGIIITDGNEYVYYEKDRRTSLGIASGNINTDYLIIDGSIVSKYTESYFKYGHEIEIAGDKYSIDHLEKSEDKQSTTGEGPDKVDEYRLYLQTPLTKTYTEEELIFVTECIKFNPTFTSTDNQGNQLIEPRPIRGLSINSYKGRLWIGGEDGNLYYSELGYYDKFDTLGDAGAFANFQEDMSSFTGLGKWSEYLIIHKIKSTYILDGNNSDTTNWTVKPYSELTCESQQSFLSNDIGYYLFDRTHKAIFPVLSRSIYNATYMGKELSTKINNVFDNIDYNKLNEIYISYNAEKQYILFYMNFLNGNGYSNICYIYDTLTKSWLVRQLPQKVTCSFTINNKSYIGTDDGLVLREFSGESFNGEPIKFKWISPSYAWGGGTNYTTTKEFRVKLQNDTSNNFNIRTITDGKRISKNRNINNNKGTGLNLIWDVGYNIEDRNIGTIDSLVYKSIGSDGNTYYSIGDPSTGIYELYTNFTDVEGKEGYVQLSGLAGKSGELTYNIASTVFNYNLIEYTPVYGYKWLGTTPVYKCYKQTDDPNILAWIIPNSNNQRAIVNLEKYQIPNKTYYAIEGRKGSKGKVVFYTTDKSVVERVCFTGVFKDDYYVAPVYFKQGDNFYRYNNYTLGNTTTKGYWWIYNVDDKDVPIQVILSTTENTFTYPDINTKEGFVLRSYSPIAEYTNRVSHSERFTRREDLDVSDYVDGYKYNGKQTKENGLEFTIDQYTEATITIDGKTYERYAAGDDGNTQGTIYTPRNNFLNNAAYTDELLTISIGNVTSYTDRSKITIEGSSEVFVYQGKTEAQQPNYYVKQIVNFPIVEVLDKLTETDYNYPELPDINSNTDTEWDNYNWVDNGYKTKRILLSNQYFETIQYELYGETLDNIMIIDGFEVDGIQLTEVPH